MSKVIKEPSIADYDYSEWVKLERQFYKDFENSTKYNKSINEMKSEILEGESYTSFYMVCKKFYLFITFFHHSEFPFLKKSLILCAFPLLLVL